MRALIIILLIILLVLQAMLWFGERGSSKVQRLEAAITLQKQENARLLERNENLQAEVVDLREGLEAIEERARNELGMIKQGETFYQVVSPGNGTSAATPAPESP